MNRAEALAGFDAARTEWERAFALVPDGALAYLKPGDDYALGGLQVHVNWVLVHYRRILDAIVAAQFGELGPQDPPGAEEAARRSAKSGVRASDRKQAIEAMDSEHRLVSRTIDGLAAADWPRKAPVVYGDVQDPYPTSPEDIVGWLTDHYREHVDQCAELIEAWRAAMPDASQPI